MAKLKFITDLAFADYDFNPDDVAAVMIHEGVHAFQNSAAEAEFWKPYSDYQIPTISWALKYQNGRERQASDIVLQENQRGRITMSTKRKNDEMAYLAFFSGGPDFPFKLSGRP